jgi:hypothetical protein
MVWSPSMSGHTGHHGHPQWDFPIPGSRLGEGTLWGTPAMMRQLAELAVQAAIQAEEEAAWHAHERTTVAAERSQVA